MHSYDLLADTVSACRSCLEERLRKEEALTVTTQRVNLHSGFPLKGFLGKHMSSGTLIVTWESDMHRGV